MNDIPPLWRRATALLGPMWRWLLAPPRCVACDERLAQYAAFCVPCADAVLRSEGGDHLPGLDGSVAFGLYGGPLAVAVRRLKYEGRTEIAPPLGRLLRTVRDRLPHEVDAVVPVPLFPVRLAERGFNQSVLLAREVVRQSPWAIRPTWLKRRRETKAQAGLSRDARRRNLARDTFVASPAVAGRSLLLVDDVATTGATLQACAHALRAGGATRVQGLVLARRSSNAPAVETDRDRPSAPWLMEAWLEGEVSDRPTSWA